MTRSPIGSRSMTSGERAIRSRKRAAILTKEMRNSGYQPATVFLPESHYKALSAFDKSTGGDGVMNAAKISYWMWRLVKTAVEKSEDEAINKLASDPDWPRHSLHEFAQLCASAAFETWANQQTERLDQSGTKHKQHDS